MTTVTDYLYNYAFIQLGKHRKRHQSPHVSIEATALVCGNTKTNKPAALRVLFDTGKTKTIVLESSIPNVLDVKHNEHNIMRWKTKGGLFTTTGKCKLKYKLPEFSTQKSLTWTMHIDSST